MALGKLAWLVVPALGLTEFAGQLYFSKRPPNLDEWRSLRPAVDALRKHDELVVVAPDWAEPNARAAFGDALMPLADVARADESARARAVEVSILGKEAPELRGWKLVLERRQGKFRLRVLDNPKPAKVLYDFLDHVPGASVSEVSATAEARCRWDPSARRDAGGLHGDPAFPAQRHVCAGASWHFVGVTVVEDQNWRGRRCIWAEPTGGSSTLTIRFPDVPLGKTIRGYATLPWWIEREKRGGPVQLEVVVGDDILGRYVHADGDGWKPFEFPTGPYAGKRAEVVFQVKASRPHQRQFCFQADTR